MGNKTNLRVIKKAQELLLRLNGGDTATSLTEAQREAISIVAFAMKADLDFVGNATDEDDGLEPRYITDLGGIDRVREASLLRLQVLDVDEEFRESIIDTVSSIFEGMGAE